MLNERDHYDYVIGQMSGEGMGRWGGLGNQEYQNRKSREYQSKSGPSARTSSSPTASSAEPAAAAVFASEWTDQISDMTAAAFSWVPNWAGRLLRILSALSLLVLACVYDAGLLTAVLAAGLGWCVPRITLNLLRGTVCVLLATIYIVWQLCVFCLILALIAAGGFIVIQILAYFA